MTDHFDDWLSAELEERLRPAALSPPPGPRYSRSPHRRGPATLIRGLAATTGAKLAIGGALAASAAGATGLAVAHHGAQPAPAPSLRATVEACKDAERPATPGIGKCVSAQARHHGDGHADAHRPAAGDHDPAGGPHDGARDHDRVGALPTAVPGHAIPAPTPTADHGSPSSPPDGHRTGGGHTDER